MESSSEAATTESSGEAATVEAAAKAASVKTTTAKAAATKAAASMAAAATATTAPTSQRHCRRSQANGRDSQQRECLLTQHYHFILRQISLPTRASR
jgi:hypothetical protein